MKKLPWHREKQIIISKSKKNPTRFATHHERWHDFAKLHTDPYEENKAGEFKKILEERKEIANDASRNIPRGALSAFAASNLKMVRSSSDQSGSAASTAAHATCNREYARAAAKSEMSAVCLLGSLPREPTCRGESRTGRYVPRGWVVGTLRRVHPIEMRHEIPRLHSPPWKTKKYEKNITSCDIESCSDSYGSSLLVFVNFKKVVRAIRIGPRRQGRCRCKMWKLRRKWNTLNESVNFVNQTFQEIL